MTLAISRINMLVISRINTGISYLSKFKASRLVKLVDCLFSPMDYQLNWSDYQLNWLAVYFFR
jgi:hypothetical protein